MAPGSEVRDSVIAKSMGISRVPVRDACNLLVQSGLLSKQEHHPYRVREFSEADLGELQLIRWGVRVRGGAASGQSPRQSAGRQRTPGSHAGRWRGR
ncbi:hypothetical protein [Curtobacterium sp. MCPF17_052]|uniref:hypothetical protein n=1 Tax=Curtobacterium sp. MCPF17_052 TaxID=2175655 RepID=UPI003464ACFB